jgi:hypothetical protein
VFATSLTLLIVGAMLEIAGVVLIALELRDAGILVHTFIDEYTKQRASGMTAYGKENRLIAELVVNLNYTGSRRQRVQSVLLILGGLVLATLGSCLSFAI